MGIEQLTTREEEILALIRQGLTNKEIAGKLLISLHTARAHTRSLFIKTGARNRTELAVLTAIPALEKRLAIIEGILKEALGIRKTLTGGSNEDPSETPIPSCCDYHAHMDSRNISTTIPAEA